MNDIHSVGRAQGVGSVWRQAVKVKGFALGGCAKEILKTTREIYVV